MKSFLTLLGVAALVAAPLTAQAEPLADDAQAAAQLLALAQNRALAGDIEMARVLTEQALKLMEQQAASEGVILQDPALFAPDLEWLVSRRDLVPLDLVSSDTGTTRLDLWPTITAFSSEETQEPVPAEVQVLENLHAIRAELQAIRAELSALRAEMAAARGSSTAPSGAFRAWRTLEGADVGEVPPAMPAPAAPPLGALSGLGAWSGPEATGFGGSITHGQWLALRELGYAGAGGGATAPPAFVGADGVGYFQSGAAGAPHPYAPQHHVEIERLRADLAAALAEIQRMQQMLGESAAPAGGGHGGR